jgi:hypothetical protein
MSFNRTQSRDVIGLLTGHNTLRRHLHILGLMDSPLCRKCGVEEETSAHILLNVRLWPLSDMCIWAPFLELEDIQSIRCIGQLLVVHSSSYCDVFVSLMMALMSRNM